MEKEYKSTAKRLAVFFEKSRDLWKNRSQGYQADKRNLQIQIRDLKRSKEKWKTKFKKSEERLAELKKKNQKIEEIKKLIAGL